MRITDNRSIQDIQKEFQVHFPYLKIEFYNAEHTTGEGSPANQLFNDFSKTIAHIISKHTEGDWTLSEQNNRVEQYHKTLSK